MSWKSDLDEVGSGSQGIVQKIGSVASKKLASSFRSEAQKAERLTAKGFRKIKKLPLMIKGSWICNICGR
jgi:rubrerythrin